MQTWDKTCGLLIEVPRTAIQTVTDLNSALRADFHAASGRGFLFSPRKRVSALQNHNYRPGDLVVYTMPKMSSHPGPRARSIHPAQMGDDYSYIVDKFWMVARLLDAGSVLLVTRKGKTRVVAGADPLLHKAGWWMRFRYGDRFPSRDVLTMFNQADSDNRAMPRTPSGSAAAVN